MNKKTSSKNRKELIAIIQSASSEELDKILIILRFVSKATPAERDELNEQLKSDEFNIREWVDLKSPLLMEGV